MSRGKELQVGLGRAIRICREEAKLGQKALAKRCETNSSWLSKIENGNVNPTLETMRRIAEALDMPISVLLAYAEDQTGTAKGR